MKGYHAWIMLAFFGSAYTFSTVRGLYWLDSNVPDPIGMSILTTWVVFTACIAVALFTWAEKKYRLI